VNYICAQVGYVALAPTPEVTKQKELVSGRCMGRRSRGAVVQAATLVGYADFLADDVRPQLERLTKYRGMRGLRMKLHWRENPQYRFPAGISRL
jgi:predicted TIM-barrel fold metal-dependent hydrolase